jgi:hypothetical protein
MAVQLSRGGSGNRRDARVPDATHIPQPMPITTTNPSNPVQFPKCNSTTPAGDRGEAVMPTGGENDIKGGYV